MKQSSFDATISALDAETSVLNVEKSAFGAATSPIARRSYDAEMQRPWRSRGVTGDISTEFPAISAIAELV